MFAWFYILPNQQAVDRHKSPFAFITSIMAAQKLFNVLPNQVTSRTRAIWSANDTDIISSFAADHLEDINSADITPLLSSLNLSGLLSQRNINGERLGPIIEVKMRRNLAATALGLQQSRHDKAHALVIPEKTRLQAARSRAFERGEEPPKSLPRPKELYTPEPWKAKKKRNNHSQTSGKTSDMNTVEEAEGEVERLKKALAAAEQRLATLRGLEETPNSGGNTITTIHTAV